MGKKRKFGSSSPSTSISTVDTKLKYSSLPDLQKKQWILEDNLYAVGDYISVLDWLREWGSRDGFDFDGVRSLRCNYNGYPLVEVEVIYRNQSIKFLISRPSLYVLAFYSALFGWRIFNDSEFHIDMGNELVVNLERSAQYKSTPWEYLGPKPMIEAIGLINSPDHSAASLGCEVFAVHLSEATRITLIRSRICGTLVPSLSSLMMPPDVEVEFSLGSERCMDVMPSLNPFVVNFSLSIAGEELVGSFIKKYKQLCKAWIVYCLSRKKICPLEHQIADSCGIKNVRTLRNSVSVLSNTNLDKIVQEWTKKFSKRQCPPEFGRDDLDFMKTEIQRLLRNR